MGRKMQTEKMADQVAELEERQDMDKQSSRLNDISPIYRFPATLFGSSFPKR